MELGKLFPCLTDAVRRAVGRVPPSLVAAVKRQRTWRSFDWQRIKRIIAEEVAVCFSKLCAAKVYAIELHGGEPTLEDVGDKDIDLLIVGCPPEIVAEAEDFLEKLVASELERLFGENPYELLGLPNIVELHTDEELLTKKLLSSRYSPPTRLA